MSRSSLPHVPLAAALFGVAAGSLLYVVGSAEAGRWSFAAVTLLVLSTSSATVARRLLRGELGVDVIAVMAMGGALLLGEHLAGAIIAVMVTGGEALERFAVTRARRELTALVARAPKVAHRFDGAALVDVDVAAIAPGDQLLVKPGEVIPADGVITSESAIVDEAALTGEARPTTLEVGAQGRSGGTNVGGPFELRVTVPVSESTYAGVIRLVAAAETSRPRFVRLADRYAVGFLVMTVTVAAGAWALSGDPLRALAVLVVATPCPLILAAPAAIIAGVSRAAREGVIVKGGEPLEALAGAKVLLLDKTGTVTAARPRVVGVEPVAGWSSADVVALAASLEQVSLHPYAPAIVDEGRARGLRLQFPRDVAERMGTGIGGVVDDGAIRVGQLEYVAPRAVPAPNLRATALRAAVEGAAVVYVSRDGELIGALLVQDAIRAEAPRALRALRALGVRRIHLVTGDHPDVAELVGDVLGVDRVFAERAPEEKVDIVRLVRREGPTIMVGDGINDAPALAMADVGIAMGARGATAASEAADVVLTADRLEGLVTAVRVAQRTRRIALESVVVGMGLSGVAMLFAAAGYIAPVVGAVLQEAIDVLVILNALRALGGRRREARPPAHAAGLAADLSAAHRTLRPQVDELSVLAAQLDKLPPSEAHSRLSSARVFLEQELLPHEEREQRTAYPVLQRMLREEDPTGPLVQTHHEIRRLARLFARLVDRLPAAAALPEELHDLRRALYGLHAVLTLHFAQEEELYSLLEA